MGIGHVMRCVTIAGALTQRGWTARLLVRDLPASLASSIPTSVSILDLPNTLPIDDEPAYVQERLSEPAALLVVDHPALDARWHSRARAWCDHSMAIDDLADRELDVDLVLNQNLGASVARYRGLVPLGSSVLAGPAFALVRPEFSAARRRARPRSGSIDRILVFMSGGDELDVTARAVRAALALPVNVDAVVGAAYPYVADLLALAATEPRLEIHVNTSDMALLMERADIAVGAPSSATWERCTLGLPSVLLTLADNQAETAERLADLGAATVLGRHTSVTEDDIVRALTELRGDPQRVRVMGEAARSVTDGQGTERVGAAIRQLITRVPSSAPDATFGR